MPSRLFFPRRFVVSHLNRWDWALLSIVCALLFALAFALSQITQPYSLGQPLPMSLDPWMLPYYLLRTMLRMFLALAASLVFSCVFAAVAAKYAVAERLMIPLLDVLQSIPILGFLSISVAGFIAIFPGNLLGVECAAIFAIFTSQAWNMAFSLFQSFRSVPQELQEAAKVFQLSGWQRFFRLELPFAMPGLLWNMMMSMSGGWFFVVAAEAISVANQNIRLPGVGSYIAMAIEARDLSAIAWVIAFMLAGIALYDQLLFRPLTAWADKFRFEETAGEMAPQSWLLKWLRRTNRVRFVVDGFVRALEYALWMLRRRSAIRWIPEAPHEGLNRAVSLVLFVAASVALAWLVVFIHDRVGLAEVAHVFLLGFYTLLRVVILIVLAALFWVPVGVWIGLNPRWADRLQGVAQFCAAFPANLMFPVAVVLILHWQLNPDVWLSPLMVLGTQWYLLFNVIAGASGVPTDLRYAVQNLNLSGWLKWRRYLLPAVFPSLVTGAVTASGGCWNASIVAEYVSWGSVTLQAQGLGSYIAHMTAVGDFPRVALGISVMCLFVMCLNRFVWHRLWQIAADRV